MDAESMATGWHAIERAAGSGQSVGPLTWAQLVELVRSGVLQPGDPVWNPALPEWIPAAQVPGLVPVTVAAPAAWTAPGTPPTIPVAAAPTANAAPPTRAPVQPVSAVAGPVRRRSLLPVVLVVMIALVAGGLGGAWYLWLRPNSGGTGPTAAPGASLAAGTSAAPTGAGASGTPAARTDLGRAETALPDPARVAATTAYGQVPLNQIIVVFGDGHGQGEAEALATSLGGRIVGRIEFLNAFQVETSGTTEADLTAALATARATAGVTTAAPNQSVSPSEDPVEIWGTRISPLSDPIYGNGNGDGYGLIGVQTAWDYIRGSGMDLDLVQVGVVDSGVWTGSNKFDEGAHVTFTEPEANRADPEKQKNKDGTKSNDPSGGHGSGVNVLIGADADDGGPAGVASVLGDKLTISNTNLWASDYGQQWTEAQPNPDDPTIVDYPDGKTYQFSSLVAIMNQVKAGSTVINMSWGPQDPSLTDPAVPKIYEAFFKKMGREHPDVLFVAAAGNHGKSAEGSKMYPGGFNLPNVMTVGNVTNDGTIWKTSNTASTDFEVSVFAPGHQAVRGQNKDTGEIKNIAGGTSMAAPQVTATAALLRSLNKDLTAEQIKKIITTSATDKGGTSVLAVDEAVRMVIDLNCDLAGIPRIDKETLLGRAVVDAVASPVAGQPGVYTVRGIVKGTGVKGVDLDITVATGEVTSGDEPASLDEPGEATWTVKLDPPDEGTITVRRSDNKAGSRIAIEQLDLNGMWAGTLTFTDLTVDEEAAKEAEDQGCSLAILEELKGKPLPMTMDITVDESGKGTAVVTIDVSSLAKPGEEPPTSSPQTIPFTLSGNHLTFQLEQSQGATSSMSGTVGRSGAALVISGTMTVSGTGFSAVAAWSVTLGQ